MIILTFYIIFAIINIIICLILAYIEYNNGEAITLENICVILGYVAFSFLGTAFIIVHTLHEHKDMVILQKKKKIKEYGNKRIQDTNTRRL